jgi:ABC-2 type transport system ATP-binding protein
VRELKAGGATFFISSHNLPEVERMCDRVGIIREGRLVAVDEVENLKRRALRNWRYISPHPCPGRPSRT